MPPATQRILTSTTRSTWRSCLPSLMQLKWRSLKPSELVKRDRSASSSWHRLQGEIAKRGVIDVLRNGIKHGPHHVDLFYGTPSPGNAKAERALRRQHLQRHAAAALQQRRDASCALDLGLFINGLPIATFELKNSLTKQTVEDAVEQYKRDRDPRSCCFSSAAASCISPWTTTRCGSAPISKGKASWFLPFNKGWNDGAGNPPNPDGLKTDYLWKEVLTQQGLTDILENYAQIVEETDGKRAERSAKQIFPRYHQLDVVRKLLADAKDSGAGKRYLIQHSAGTGKSNSIAWLAHQLIGLETDGKPIFDSVIVVTDRRVLDKQIRDTIKQFAQVGVDRRPCRTVGRSAELHLKAARRSSSRRSRSSRSSSTKSATNIAGGRSRSSSTRRIPARAGAPRRR